MPLPALKRLLLVILLCLSLPAVGGKVAPASVNDLQYGETLFHYFQQNYFDSIVRLQVAQQQQRLPNHKDEAELLLGGMDLSYGLREAARNIFERLLGKAHTDTSTQNRAWLYLAKISYQRGDLAGALEAVGKVSDTMGSALQSEVINLHSLLLLQQGRNSEAIAVLENNRSAKHWSPYLKYNLGVAQVRDGQLIKGAKQLETVGAGDDYNEEQRLLRDKANLALGYSYLQNGQTIRSRQALERVRLKGPLSNKALLGTGWADAESGAYDQALIPWMELSQRSTADPAVQEVLLAIPYAMTRMQLHGRAVQHYNEGISALITEKGKLEQSIHALQQGELLKLLEQQDLDNGNGWLQQLELDADTPAMRYQVTLMASHDFQEAVKNYRDLLILQKNLDQWAVNIEAYDEMLSSRQARYDINRPAATRALGEDKVGALQRRYHELAVGIENIEVSGDATGLANAMESRQWQRLAAIQGRLEALPDNPQIAALRDKHRRLTGILFWTLGNQYKQRLWQAKRQLAELEQLLQKSHLGLATLRQADLDAPTGLSGFEKRIARQKSTVTALQARADNTRLAQGLQLQQLAVNELQKQQERIDTYIIKARFALAQTYDSAVNKQRPGGTVQ